MGSLLGGRSDERDEDGWTEVRVDRTESRGFRSYFYLYLYLWILWKVEKIMCNVNTYNFSYFGGNFFIIVNVKH